MARTPKFKVVQEEKGRFPQLMEFLEKVAKAADTSNVDHFFRSGEIRDHATLKEIGKLFLTLAMGFEEDEFIPYVTDNSSEGPDFVPQSEQYYPWVFYAAPTDCQDLSEIYDRFLANYLHSDVSGKKDFAIITNFKKLIVCDLNHYLEDYDVAFADLVDAIRSNSKSRRRSAVVVAWTKILQEFGPPSSEEKKKSRRLEVVNYVNPKESRVEFIKRFGHTPDFQKPVGWDGRGFRETFKSKDLPFLTAEEFSWNGTKCANRLVWGDNLAVMRCLPDECIDLIYIDPPFFSGRQYNLIFGDDDEVRTFSDIWDGGLPTYLGWLNARLFEMKRLLKASGTLYVHLDWHAAHYVKAELDKIFGPQAFLCEVIWSYRGGGRKTNLWARKHDNILMYGKDPSRTKFFSGSVLEPPTEAMLRRYNIVGKDGRRFANMKGKIRPMREGSIPTDVWEIAPLSCNETERIGYPTQKPEELLERIIASCTENGDVVADFFSGGGTTIVVAEKLGRRWIGCDISRIAVSVARDRLLSVYETKVGVRCVNNAAVWGFSVQNHGSYEKSKVRTLGERDYIRFVLSCFEAEQESKRSLIHGFKGEKAIHVASQAGRLKVGVVDEFHEELTKEKIPSGIILAWEWDQEVDDHVRNLRKGSFGPDIQLIQVKLLKIDSQEFQGDNVRFLNKPVAIVHAKERAGRLWDFDGSASQGRNGTDIHFYQWDFNYKGRFNPMTKPNFSVEGDGDGNPLNDNRKVEYEFPEAGKYKVALRIIDKSGAEAVETKDIEVKEAAKRKAA